MLDFSHKEQNPKEKFESRRAQFMLHHFQHKMTNAEMSPQLSPPEEGPPH